MARLCFIYIDPIKKIQDYFRFYMLTGVQSLQPVHVDISL